MSEPRNGDAPDKTGPRHDHRHRGGFLEEWRDTWAGIFILMIVAGALGALLTRLLPGMDASLLPGGDDLQSKVTQLETQVLKLANAQSSAPEQDVSDLRARLATLEGRVKAAETVLASLPPHAPPNPQGPGVPPPTPDGAAPPAGAPPSAPPASAPPASAAAPAVSDPRLDAAVKAVEDIQARLAVLEIAAKTQGAAGVTSGSGPGAAAPVAQSELQSLKDSIEKISQTLGTMAARVDDVSARVALAVDPAPQIAVVRGEVEAVAGRVTKIEQADPAGSARRAALGAAVASLTRAAQGPQPFLAEWRLVSELTGTDPALSELEPLAAAGVPNLPALVASFPQKAEAALRAERDAAAGDGWQRIWSGVSGVVAVRPTGTPEGADSASILARAQARLKTGDLRAAAAETVKLAGAAGTAFAGWQAQASSRLKLEEALGALNARVVKSIAPPPAP